MLTDVVLPLKPWTVVTALLIHCCLAVTQTPKYCARFEFPDLPNLALVAPEGSLVNVSFRLVFNTTPTSSHLTHTLTPTQNNDNGKAEDQEDIKCLDRQRIVLGISKESSNDDVNHHERDCFLRVTATNTGSLCQSFTSHRCRCIAGGVTVGRGDAVAAAGGGGGAGGGGRTLRLTLQLTQRVGKGDEGWWRWWTRDNVAPPASVFLGVSDKAPEDKENAKNQQNNQPNNINIDDNNDADTRNNAKEISEPQPPSTVPSDATINEAENTTDDDNNNNNNSNNNTTTSSDNKSPNAEVKEGEKNKNDDGDDDNNDTKTADAPAMNVSYVGAIVAGVNISTVIVIAIVVVVARRVCCKHRRHDLSPRPCSMNAILTEQRRNTMSSTMSSDYSYSTYGYGKRVSTSSYIYDEIPNDAIKKALITTESSLYLHPIECTTTTTTTPTTTSTTASAVTSTTITISK